MRSATLDLGHVGRVLTNRRGQQVTTAYSDEEALAKCAASSSTFAQDLARKSKRGLSGEQWWWVHTLSQPPAPKEAAAVVDVTAIKRMFDEARKHLRNPRIRLMCGDGLHIQVKPAKDGGKNPGAIYVTAPEWDTYLGKITPQGEWLPTSRCEATVTDLLVRFAADPLTLAKEYGRLLGNCCFCGQRLSDERSTDVGYGPVCAEHFGLKWGGKR